MRFKDIFIISKGTRVILAITLTVATLAVVFAFFYYRSVNRSEDPRILKAREFLAEYDRISVYPKYGSIPFTRFRFCYFQEIPDYRSLLKQALFITTNAADC